MHVHRSPAKHKLFDTFLRGGEQAGFEITPDHNGYRQEGLHVAQVSIHEGVRWSSARAYLRPALKRGNLELLPKTLVRRVVIRDGAALGVEVGAGSELRTITCGREVVLCAGPINSPKLLLLSGIGPASSIEPVVGKDFSL